MLAEAYDLARLEAAAQTLLEDDTFAAERPYSWADIMERPINPPID